MRLYDRVKQALEDHPVTRNSDRALMWHIWRSQGHTFRVKINGKEIEVMNWHGWNNCRGAESITRCRRKVQEQHPELCATKPIQQARRKSKVKITIFDNSKDQRTLSGQLPIAVLTPKV